jgi:tetratricopeptide (TPR) repeat protein
MVRPPVDPHTHNEDTYDQLISLIENSQGRLAPILVACDSPRLRQQMIQRYEAEARQAQIRPYRIELGKEPSLRAGLANLKDQDPYLQQTGAAVFTVTGADLLLRVKINSQDAQSEVDKFLGYLQWTREGLREFPYPIVLWVSHRLLRDLKQRARDFWSWRKAELRFLDESPAAAQATELLGSDPPPTPHSPPDFSTINPHPPIAELQAEIAQLTTQDPNALALATLYDRLSQAYTHRIQQGHAKNLDKDRQHAIAAFEQAIARYQTQNYHTDEMWALNRLGLFLHSQSRYAEAISNYEKVLTLAREIGDREGEAMALGNIGNAYNDLGQSQQAVSFHAQSLEIWRELGDRYREGISLNNIGNTYSRLGHYQQTIDFHAQALQIRRELGDREGEGVSLGNLGNAYINLGQHERALDFYQQALEVQRKIGNREYEANALNGLGLAHHALGQYQRAIDFYSQALDIRRKIGDRRGEAWSLYNRAGALAKLGQSWPALQTYQQSKQVFQDLQLDDLVEQCDTRIYELNRVIAATPPAKWLNKINYTK